MAFDLNPLALANAPILRLIDNATSHEISTVRGLAAAAGRDESNVGKSLRALAAAKLIHPDPLMNGLTDAGRDQLAALDRAADPSAGAGAGPVVLHGDMEPHPLNPRKDFETGAAEEDLDELRTSIVKKGLLQPILIRPREGQPGKWWIIAGERRWRAIGQAIFDGDWDEDRPVPVTTRDVTDGEHLLLALIENLQRSNMSAIEEAAGFALAISEYGQTTDGLANATGKSQRFIQQRLALLKLPQEDQDRMRLPRDHPDHLSFKAARAMTQTPKTPEPGAKDWAPDPLPDPYVNGTREDAFAAIDAAAARAREPGSPPAPEPSPTPEAPSFGKGLTDRMALAFVEIVDKAEKHPAADPALASESYTPCQAVPVEGVLGDLVARGAVGFRRRGNETFVRPRLHSTNARAWLDEIGFDARRDDVLFEMRARVVGTDEAAALAACGNYASLFLNPANITPVAPPASPSLKQVLTDLAADDQAEPDQPALIEETDEEKAARIAGERERAAVAADREVANRLSEEVVRALSAARRGDKPFGEVLAGNGSNEGLSALAAAAFGALASGEPELAAAAIAQLVVKGGSMGARGALNRLTVPEIGQAMIRARVAKPDPNRGSAAPEPEADTVEDFVQAELDDEEADAGGVWSEAFRPHGGPGSPAVPTRKSITPDFIVCLEDGRKFKSLTRHLRTKYNLSPEEYRAKWALPRDYPMVAPNFAKARADLARQMGLKD